MTRLLRVAVAGAAGYAGGELLRLLLQHPHVREVVATSRSQAGKPIADVHPGLAPLTDARFAGLTPGEAAGGCDVIFLALEHGESSRLIGEVFSAGPGLVVDLAADFRIQSPRLYEQFYGAHPSPDYVNRFAYGLADIEGASLKGATAIAAPGCFATAAQLALWPIARAGIACEPVIFAVTGSSGAGVHPKASTHHPARGNNVFAYSILGHRHDAEVLSSWRAWTGRPDAQARLMVHGGPFVRGIYATLHARLAAPHPALAKGILPLYREAYGGRPFVRVMDRAPDLTQAVGTNYAFIHAAMSDDGRELQVIVAEDNLVKGAGGQAIQAMNLALGLAETAGLEAVGVYPC
jgi:N-acetyl-gamma-glutamyl-phosphate reductase common form